MGGGVSDTKLTTSGIAYIGNVRLFRLEALRELIASNLLAAIAYVGCRVLHSELSPVQLRERTAFLGNRLPFQGMGFFQRNRNDPVHVGC